LKNVCCRRFPRWVGYMVRKTRNDDSCYSLLFVPLRQFTEARPFRQ
jgi:hypothetical protein